MSTEAKSKRQVIFGKPRSKNPNHLANVLIRFGNGDYVRGIMIYRGDNGLYLRYPSYKNANGSQKPFFRLNPATEKALLEAFVPAQAAGKLVNSYDLSMEETSIFSSTNLPIATQ